MKRNIRIYIYLALALALIGSFAVGGEVLARSAAIGPGQTVPSPTPTPTLAPPTVPAPPATPMPPDPSATPVPPAPTETPVPGAQSGRLTLTITADQLAVLPGMTTTFTITVKNAGAASLRNLTLVNTLPDGLEPGRILVGPSAAWSGQTLRASAPVLAPGGALTFVYTARVRPDIAPKAVLMNQAVATSGDGQRATAFVALGQPPMELPITGGVIVTDSRSR